MPEPKGITIDPEVEEILRTIAADPGSSLLRVPRPQRVMAFFDRGRGVSSVAAGLTSAERHLVRSYRSDVAWLLRESCRMKLIDGPKGQLHISPFRSAREEHRRWKPEVLSARIRENRLEKCIQAELDSGWRLLDHCVEAPYGDTPSVTQLAEASLRLEATDEARIMAALDLTTGGAPKAGIRILAHVLEEPSANSVAICARGNIGMAHSFLGEIPLALKHYSAACSLGGECINQSMNRLFFGIQLGNIEEARAASLMMEAAASESLAAVALFADNRGILRLRGTWTPSSESREAVRRLGRYFGPASRRIARVFE